MVAISQLNRGPETHRPQARVDDLRESGSIEQDADVVILLHREDAYEKDSHDGEADIIVAKHRNGPTATVVTAFQGTTRFGICTGVAGKWLADFARAFTEFAHCAFGSRVRTSWNIYAYIYIYIYIYRLVVFRGGDGGC